MPSQQLWKDFQGDLDFEYDHEEYWPALIKLCQEKHVEQVERWVKAGKHYGESELYIQGGNTPSVGQGSSQQTVQTSEKGKENAPTDPSAAHAPAQTLGAQANNNMDIAAETAKPVTTEVDRS